MYQLHKYVASLLDIGKYYIQGMHMPALNSSAAFHKKYLIGL